MVESLEEKLNLSPEQFRAIFARPVAYHKLLAIAGGSVGAGVFLSQLIYWTDKSKDPDGWIYKTLDDWWCETALGRYELKTIRNTLVSRTLIEEKLCGVPARLHYKIDWPSLQVALAKAVITHREGMSKRGAPTNKYVAVPHTGDATSKNGASPQTTYRSESTTKNTKTKTSSSALATNGNGAARRNVVVVSLASAEDDPREAADKLIEEFGPFNSKQSRFIQDYIDKDSGYVIRQAEIVRSEPRENAARAFMAALRDDWQKAKRIIKSKQLKETPRPLQEEFTEMSEEQIAKNKVELASLKASLKG
jgi:hypothetical protein